MPKITRKSIKERFPYIISAGNGNLQHLLRYEKRFGHCERAEGWACDVYVFIGECSVITDGYASFGNIKASYDVMREYDNKAYEIEKLYPFNISYTEMQERLHNLIVEFMHVCTKEV